MVAPLVALGLPALRQLPRPILLILGLYALSQQLPALLSPEPLVASLLTLGRTLLMLGLIGVGVLLRSSERLRPVAIGLGLIYITAIIYSAAGGADLLISRLGHPYMTAIALGLAGAYGVWVALFAGGSVWWRLPLAVTGLGVMLLSGSRGPLVAMLVGAVAGSVIRRGRRVVIGLLLGSALLVGGVLAGERLGLDAVTRLDSTDTTGRDVVWYNTLTMIRAYPWAGVGSYRLGKYLGGPDERCPVLVATDPAGSGCPAWVRQVGSPWLIAHSLSLQQLAETGPLGLLGLFTLLSAVVAATLTARQPLAGAVIFGMLAATITDNTLLVPSPFFAELFWVIAGTQLLSFQLPTAATGGVAAIVLTLLSLPLLGAAVMSRSPQLSATQLRLSFFSGPTTLPTTAPAQYTVYAKFDVPPGSYRASLNSCAGGPPVCTALVTLPFQASSQGSELLTFTTHLPATPQQQLELRLLPGASSFWLQPLAVHTWAVSP
ncbi:O-antigen ligase family protein (plasmid) [Deinococcus sp. KNUC1210]|uniref:O-antigen ligase family protein n=1 Tax=Deinococcus sp. KNUC1210 TaxID=2917691 RepID=UPI001EEF8784|nr:O-antigen ligase family protein [Deinococcus sp. KNUC1210]ULH14260.1 O-antigen ligase family protein [Deinococcus sp. KNUC1210]